MEEARQHPTLTRANWVAVAAYLGFGFCALAILVSAFVDSDWIVPLSATACICAVVQLLANSADGLMEGRVKWRKRIYSCYERPKWFWSLLGVNATFVCLFVFVALFLMNLIP
ncbi:hypothetical protein [uncultured Sphingomonas sp.]|uniref:hypothetical protein n=1 Tax=uncultured Sphingomonas sp. TaxID=158754 RepID=UPI0035C9C734